MKDVLDMRCRGGGGRAGRGMLNDADADAFVGGVESMEGLNSIAAAFSFMLDWRE